MAAPQEKLADSLEALHQLQEKGGVTIRAASQRAQYLSLSAGRAQVWCADITYLPMRRGFLYLVAIMDWVTRSVLAWRNGSPSTITSDLTLLMADNHPLWSTSTGSKPTSRRRVIFLNRSNMDKCDGLARDEISAGTTRSGCPQGRSGTGLDYRARSATGAVVRNEVAGAESSVEGGAGTTGCS